MVVNIKRKVYTLFRADLLFLNVNFLLSFSSGDLCYGSACSLQFIPPE